MFCILFVFVICGFLMIFIPYNRILEVVYAGIGAIIFSVYLIIDTQMMMGGHHKFSISPEEYVFAGKCAAYASNYVDSKDKKNKVGSFL